MATLKQRMHKKNSSGSYDTVHLETSSSLVLRPSGRTVEQDLADYLPKTQASDTPPSTLKTGLMVTGESKLWVGIKDLPTEVQLEMANTTNIITITQIPNNQYGYRVQLLDTDGSPLKDVVIKGIDDPNTEIRTNAEGIVQFYSGKSSFSGLTYSGFPDHLDMSMFPKTMQGYINDTSVVIVNPDVSGYYGYDITVTDKNDAILPNTKVYDATGNNVVGTTDNTGHLIMYRQASSLSISAVNGINYTKGTVTGTRGSLKAISFKISGHPYEGTLTLGSTITCCGNSWIVCHIDGKKYYLALSTIYSKTTFGLSNNYSGSDLATKATNYKDTLRQSNALIVDTFFANVAVEGVSDKVFVATYDQMNGGFSYFNSDSRRVCKYNGSADWYWTSSPYSGSGVWYVLTDGSLNYTRYPSNSNGFRPFVCLSL